jgi:DNA-binding GntR family transcriptional regulator
MTKMVAAKKLEADNGSLAEVAYQHLRTAILDCSLLPGERVTEASEMARLELGKTPVREALQRLVREGLVVVMPRQGYQVAPITLRDVEELFGLRMVVEPAAVALAAVRLTPTELARLEKLCHAGYDTHDPASLRSFTKLNREFHAAIAWASGNRRLAELVERLLVETQRLIHYGMLLRPRSEEAVHEHEELVAALTLRDATKARSICEAQIEAARRMVFDSLTSASSLREMPIGLAQP